MNKIGMFKSGLLLSSSLVLIAGFQNCSKVTAETLNTNSKLEAATTSGVEIIPEDSTPIAEVAAASPDSTVAPVSPASPISPVVSDDSEHEDNIETPHIVREREEIHVVGNHGNCGGKKDDHGKRDEDRDREDHDRRNHEDHARKEDDSKKENDREIDFVALCLKHEKVALHGTRFVDIRGNTSISGNDIDLIEDVRGYVVVRGDGQNSRIHSIQNTRGQLVVCGMHVDKIEDVRGGIQLVNSTVTELVDHRGNVKVIDTGRGNGT